MLKIFQPNINTEPAPKVFLQNKLSRANAKLVEAKGVVGKKGTFQTFWVQSWLIGS